MLDHFTLFGCFCASSVVCWLTFRVWLMLVVIYPSHCSIVTTKEIWTYYSLCTN